MAKEPEPSRRIEMMLAHLTSLYVNAHLKEGAQSKSPDDFMFQNPWPVPSSDERYSETDRQVLAALM